MIAVALAMIAGLKNSREWSRLALTVPTLTTVVPMTLFLVSNLLLGRVLQQFDGRHTGAVGPAHVAVGFDLALAHELAGIDRGVVGHGRSSLGWGACGLARYPLGSKASAFGLAFQADAAPVFQRILGIGLVVAP